MMQAFLSKLVTFGCAITLAFGTLSAHAGFDEGLAAYERGDYATALKEWRPLARQGHASAQYNLGVMYDQGRGVPQDYAEAVKWYRQAAAQGHAKAQSNLGLMYAKGRGVPQDYAEAVKWYRQAAAQGLAAAQYNLGVMYDEGWGVPQDKVLAYALYNLSAAGDPSKDNKAPRNRESIAQGMSREAILAGQALTRELAKPGNFAQALDAHLKASRRPR
ncbi:tetratricopeptide repeat protein [Tepidimonas aquatica]|uniref:Secretory immunoglobulin A-binding protein EsiB n=1 Tax=Tepidimonas aquatica TaxID=247482 RepID=A0A554WK22_9BURK|nr:tetratricopeptide repeat protein [Tepidimonas aquatica]TSE23937.1 Secretory immunoglobulin A-binding protein EsiB [Tepidimonas aquatica]